MLKNLIQATLLMVLDYISDFTNFRSCCRMRTYLDTSAFQFSLNIITPKLPNHDVF